MASMALWRLIRFNQRPQVRIVSDLGAALMGLQKAQGAFVLLIFPH